MRVTKYRVWFIPKGLNKVGTPLWAVATDHGDGKKRTPFIYARTCGAALDKLRERYERRQINQKKRRKPPMRRPGCRSS